MPLVIRKGDGECAVSPFEDKQRFVFAPYRIFPSKHPENFFPKSEKECSFKNSYNPIFLLLKLTGGWLDKTTRRTKNEHSGVYHKDIIMLESCA